MKMKWEQVEELYDKRDKERHKNKLQKKGINSLYYALKREFPTGKVRGMKIKQYVEILQAEIADEEKQF